MFTFTFKVFAWGIINLHVKNTKKYFGDADLISVSSEIQFQMGGRQGRIVKD